MTSTTTLPPHADAIFAKAYATDLVFIPDCWQLCGDAHCCSFSRHKARFSMFDNAPQELPLLPGEWAFLCANGWNQQFGDYEIRPHSYEFGGHTISWTSMSSRRPGCACDHDTRTVVCRLYPLLPVLGTSGEFMGTEPLGMYEELERLAGLPPACQVDRLPLDQVNVMLDLVNSVGGSPALRFALGAYRAAKHHAFGRLEARMAPGADAFRQFELALFRKRLFDHNELSAELTGLWDSIETASGADLGAELAALAAADAAYLPAD